MTLDTAYLTHDEVNADLARRIAGRFGITLTVFAVKDASAARAADRLVLDLDHLPAECKAGLLAEAATGGVRPGVSVHSYHLTRAEARHLRRAGVSITRRLTAAAILCREPSGAVGAGG
jgi:hypothetical protein